MTRFRVTYETITPGFAEDGDFCETGFVMPGGWNIDLDTALADKERDYTMTLREALNLASPDCDCGRWFEETGDGRCDYATGIVERRSIHPPANITPASYARVKRLIGVL